MQIIKNTKCLQHIQKYAKQNKSATDLDIWKSCFDIEGIFKFPKGQTFPYILQGIDHIKITNNQIVFYDIGCNNMHNSFILRKN